MKHFFLLLSMCLITAHFLAQTKTITGIVSDENGLPLPGTNVLVKHSTNGTQTDFNGKYTIQVQVGNILQFSYIGYQVTEIKLTKKVSEVNVSMVPDNSVLEEVVIMGYGARKESKSVGYSVSSVQSEQISGRVAGVQVTSGSAIKIRGNSSPLNKNKPLYVVDGMIVSEKKVSKINPNNIQSVNVLKDSNASAIYGARGKNGVIVVSTLKGNNHGENESYDDIVENSFEVAKLSPLSTFSIDVDKASYSNVRRMINNGQHVMANAVKIEEMINYFDYNYPQPTNEHPFSINTEVVQTPWNDQTQLVRIGLQGKTFENDKLPPSNLTFLIDVSGSMSDANKLPLLKSAFKLLVNQLREQDKVSIVVYAGAAGLVLEPTSGAHKEDILEALNKLSAGGSTAGGQGIELAYEVAAKNFKKNGNNRVILATDGDFNVGASSDKAMETLIEEKRKSGVFLSVLGFGYGNYKDSKLETLADKGNGNHAYIDNMQEAQKVFGKEFGGTLFTIAKDVKIQVEFNPSKVQAYRLIGYENRMLSDEDFVDDTKDAGELGSGHTVTALYEVIPVGVETNLIKELPDLKYTQSIHPDAFSDELLTVKFRYKKPESTKSIEMVQVVKDIKVKPSEDMNFASAVALFGMQLRESKYYNNATLEEVIKLAQLGRGVDREGYRAEFIRLVSAYRNM